MADSFSGWIAQRNSAAMPSEENIIEVINHVEGGRLFRRDRMPYWGPDHWLEMKEMSYYVPEEETVYLEVRKKNMRNAKELEYMNAMAYYQEVARVALKRSGVAGVTMQQSAELVKVAELAMDAADKVSRARWDYLTAYQSPEAEQRARARADIFEIRCMAKMRTPSADMLELEMEIQTHIMKQLGKNVANLQVEAIEKKYGKKEVGGSSRGKEGERVDGSGVRWAGPMKNVENWKTLLGASPYILRSIKYGIYQIPDEPFVSGKILGEIPQVDEDLEFGQAELDKGLREEVYAKITMEEVKTAVAEGLIVSSAFVVRRDLAGAEPRFVINLHEQSKHWHTKSVKLDTLAMFASYLKPRDHLISWDLREGYRHFRLHPKMRKYFMFRYAGEYYTCVALPFGWGPSVLWFTKMLKPYAQYLRTQLNLHLLQYIDDFAARPNRNDAKAATRRDCRRVTSELDALHASLGLVRHPNKGEWRGSTVVEHLGMVLDTEAFVIRVMPRKIEKIQRMARVLRRKTFTNRGHVGRAELERFVGTVISVSLGFTLSRFYTRSMYWDLADAKQQHRYTVRLSAQSRKDLQMFIKFNPGDGRAMQAKPDTAVLHSDASDVGYGGTLGFGPDFGPGVLGDLEAQDLWRVRDVADNIAVKELRAIRLLLSCSEFAGKLEAQRVRLYADNVAVVHIVRNMVSSSPDLMAELRKLEEVLRLRGVELRPTWLASAANRFADALSRSVRAGTEFVAASRLREILLTTSSFMNIRRPVLMKLQVDQLKNPWNDGLARIWIPPLDYLPVVVKQILHHRARGLLICPQWMNQPWYQQATRFGTIVEVIPPGQFLYRGHSGARHWTTVIIEFSGASWQQRC